LKVLTIIVSYNFERWIDRCLSSLRQSSVPIDVVVVDNNSQDNTVSIIGSRYPEVFLIKSRDNLGFGKANNIGIKMACQKGYDAVYLLNQDAWIKPNTVETLCRLSKSHPEYGILSPIHLDGTEAELDKGFADYTGLKSLNAVNAITNNGDELKEVHFVNAAHWFIPVSVLKRIGGFSPLFHLYGEDIDLVNRLHHFGYRLGYSPQAFGTHDRAKRTVSQSDIHRARYVYLLSEYANINKKFPSAFAYSILASVKSAAINALHSKWNDAADYMRIFTKLSKMTTRVMATRRITCKEGAHFILDD